MRKGSRHSGYNERTETRWTRGVDGGAGPWGRTVHPKGDVEKTCWQKWARNIKERKPREKKAGPSLRQACPPNAPRTQKTHVILSGSFINV